MDTKQRDATYVAHTYNRFPLEITGGKGSIVWDETGKEYIDLGTGIAVNTFGVADDAWIAAVTEQLSCCQHTSNLFYTAPCATLAEMLSTRTGMKRVFFSNSGAEANECAIKAARKYACDKRGADCYEIITLQNSFHGRTITTLAATGQDSFHRDFLPLTEGFISIEPTADALRAAVSDKTAAILFEIVRGEGGVLPLDPAFVNEMVKIAHDKDILLIADEVQCGNGRSGMLYAYMHYGFTPDIVTTAKGLAGGLPLGATLLGEKVQDTFSPGLHGSTFGGNPVACAGAVNILSRINDTLLTEVQQKAEMIKTALTDAPGIQCVTGLGLMIGILTVRPAADVVRECRDAGLIVLTAKNKVRLLPALNIPDKTLLQALDILKTVCAKES